MRRPGATLVEVLVAIFVMGIGLLAVLALFPLGVIRMAQAIQDSHTTNCALNAKAIATIKNIRHDPTFITTCQNPGGGLTAATSQGPSYPVFIDPIGYRNAAATTYQSWLSGTTGTIPRISLPFVTGANADLIMMSWFTFRDDLIFDTNGMPIFVAANKFERDVRYSWGYLCQMPKVAEPSAVNMAVVVYNRRPLGGTGGLSLNEYYYSSLYDTNRNVVTVTVAAGGTPPPVRPGDWVLDCTQVTASAHGYFYRVVNITDISGNGTQFDIEVQTPFRGFLGTSIAQNPANSGIYVGQTMVLEGVAEVYERGTGWVP